ncbi:hypothetical protein AB0H73_37725 [Streptomyces olivoreticuli]
MTDIRMSPDVRNVLGPDGVAKAGAVTLNNAVCLGCEEKIYPNEPANVVVRIAGAGWATGCVAHVRYAHGLWTQSATPRGGRPARPRVDLTQTPATLTALPAQVR